jgi:predicted transcriptional regulator of viral defense system
MRSIIQEAIILPLVTCVSGRQVNMKQKLEEIKTLAKRANGIFRTADLKKLGFTAYEIRKMLEKHFIERIKHGYYSLSETVENCSDAEIIARLFPEGVICMYTALFYHGYSDRTPLAWDIAINKDVSKSRFKIDYPYVQPYYMEAHLLLFGITNATYGDTDLKIFDKDRLICECVFFENKIDRETYNKAIQGYIADPNKNISNLLDYSKKRRILKKIKSRIGIWL